MANASQPGRATDDRALTGLLRAVGPAAPRSSQPTESLEAFFERIVAFSPMGMQIFSVENDRLVLIGANPAADRILGLDHGPLLGLSIEEAFPYLAGTEVPAHYRRIAAQGGSWRTQQVRAEAEKIGRAFEVHAFSVGPGQLATLFFDITRRMRVEAEIADWKQRYELVASASGEVVYDYDLATGAILWSGSLTEVLGYSPAQMKGGIEQWTECIHPEHQAEVVRQLEQSTRQAASFEVKYRFLHKDGSYRWVHDRGHFVTDSAGKAARMIGMMRDITEQRRMEENLVQAQKMEAIGRLAGGIAHDFNNILTAIIGFNERVLNEVSHGSNAYSHTLEIGKAAQRAAALTHQLLAFGRKQVLQLRVLNLNDLILDYKAMLARIIGENIDFSIELAPALRTVKTDHTQIGQILMNLALNARDAMPNGGRLRIRTSNFAPAADFWSTHPEIPPADYVRLDVTDTGHGLDEAARDRLFEPFFTTKEIGQGSGLGLASTYGIVRQNNGFLLVESQPSRGTSFSVYLPVSVGEPDTAQPAPDTSADQLPRGSETILVAEDEPAVLEFAALILGELGYRVLTAANGEQALHVARRHGPDIDLLLTDVVMPQMSGKDLAETLVAERPSLKVLYASGYTRDVFGPGNKLPPEAAFLPKPFTSALLAKAVRQVLDRPDPP